MFFPWFKRIKDRGEMKPDNVFTLNKRFLCYYFFFLKFFCGWGIYEISDDEKKNSNEFGKSGFSLLINLIFFLLYQKK